MLSVLDLLYPLIENLAIGGMAIIFLSFIISIIAEILERNPLFLISALVGPAKFLRKGGPGEDTSSITDLFIMLVKIVHPIFLLSYLYMFFHFFPISSIFAGVYAFVFFLGILYYLPENILGLFTFRNKNIRRFEQMVSDLLDSMEDSFTDGKPSAKPIVMEALKPYLQNYTESSKNWDDFDYANYSYSTIFHIAFDALSSGRFHISTGSINPLGPGPHLLKIVHTCLNWSCDNGYITDEEKAETISCLNNNIHSAG